MAEFMLQREVRTPNSESYFVLDEQDRDVGRMEVHYPHGLVHATLILQSSVTDEEIREIVNRFFHEMNHTLGIDGLETAVHAYVGEDRGVFHNDDNAGRRNGNGHSNN